MSIFLHMNSSRNQQHAGPGMVLDDHQALPENLFEIPELACHIFSYLAAENKHLSALSKVNSLWHAASADLHVLVLHFERIESLTLPELENWKQILLNRYAKDWSIEEIIQKCTGLRKLDLSKSNISDQELKEILGACKTSLEELILNGCEKLISPDFNDLKNLKILSLKNGPEVSFNLKGLTKLSTLCLESCGSLKDPVLEDLDALENLILKDCGSLQKLDFNKLPALKVLDLARCTSLDSVNIEKLTSLRTINFHNCIRLRQFIFPDLPFLLMIDLNFCTGLELLDLEKIHQLKELNLKYCERLEKLNYKTSLKVDKIYIDSRTLARFPQLGIYNPEVELPSFMQGE